MIRFGHVWVETARGKSIGRIIANTVWQQWRGQIDGLVLDLACGRAPSYWKSLGLMDNPHVHLIGVDYDGDARPHVIADLRHRLPFKSGVADAVIVTVLHIFADPTALLREARRVCKTGGKLLLSAPLVYPHVPEPTDYWRFTDEALRMMLDRSGFREITLVPLGNRWSTAAYVLTPYLRPRKLVAPIVYWACLRLDAWTARRFRIPSCPIAYVAIAEAVA